MGRNSSRLDFTILQGWVETAVDWILHVNIAGMGRNSSRLDFTILQGFVETAVDCILQYCRDG